MRVAGGEPASIIQEFRPPPWPLPALQPYQSSRFTHLRAPLLSYTLVRLVLVPSRPKLTRNTCTVQGDTLQSLFTKLRKKAGEESIGYVVGAGWVKYEWNSSFWDLDDGRLTRGASTLQSLED
jgi:hypothetical protein